MPSVRSRLFRLMLRTVVARRFRKAGTSVEDLRNLAVELGRRQRVPSGIDVEAVELAGGIRGEWLTPTGAAADRAVLDLHGGLVMGSVATHRELAARIARSSGCRVLAIDYRLAPEFPFPSAVEDTVASYRAIAGIGSFVRERAGAGRTPPRRREYPLVLRSRLCKGAED